VRAFFAGVLVVVAVSGCGVFGDSDEPAAISRDQLAIMVVPQDELGPAYETLTLDADSGRTMAAEFADDTVDPEDTAASVKRAGWRDGYQLSYSVADASALTRPRGLYGIVTEVDSFEGGSAARAHILKTVADLERFEGTRVEGIKLERFEAFDAEIGDGAWGMEYTVSAGEFRAHATDVAFYADTLVGSVSVVRGDAQTARVEALRLAAVLANRADRVLAGEVDEEPVSLEAAKPHVARARIARMTLSAADLPPGARVKEERLDTSDEDYIAYVRSFELANGRLGTSSVISVRAETQVYADRRSVEVIKQLFAGKSGRETFVAATRSGMREDGVRLRRVSTRPFALGDPRIQSFVLSFSAPRGRFDMVFVMVDHGSARAMLLVFGPAGGIEAQDVRPLAAKARTKLG
jgi:hypothetical protein